MTVSGVPWLPPGATRTIPAARLESRVLCKRHNSALSTVDTQATRLTKAIRRFDRDLGIGTDGGDEYLLFHGSDLERWLLKALCCQLAAGNVGMGSSKIIWQPEPEWNRVLFEEAEIAAPAGLFFAVPSTPVHSGDYVGMTTISIESPAGPIVGGVVLELAGFALCLSMLGKLKAITGGATYTGFVHRPARLIFTDGVRKKVIEFGWGTAEAGQDVLIRHSGRYSGPPPG
jgi:hypothetical protein